MRVRNFAGRLSLLSVGLAFLVTLSACGIHLRTSQPPDPTAQQEPDRFLYQRGSQALERKRWLQAREYFRTLVDTYPTSTYRQDAKLGIGDSFLGEKRTESDILAASEFREFLRFFPLAERADYAQYRLAVSQVRQVLKPERDQTPTRDALKELDTFLKTYTQSKYLTEVTALHRQTRDRLSESELQVAQYYFRVRHYLGTISRLEELMKVDPNFSHRDGVYYYLAEAYYRVNRRADAKVLFQRLVDDFKVSEHLKDAEQRLATIAAEPAAPVNAATPAPAKPEETGSPAPPAAPPPATGAAPSATPTAR